MGRQVSRTAGGVTTTYLYDGGQILLEKQGAATTATYTYGTALIRKDGEYPLFDGQGSERTVTNGGGAVQGALTATPWGRTLGSTGGSSSPYQWGATSGYRNDGDGAAGQGQGAYVKVGCRYYDPLFGRFLSRDTDLDQKLYAYCDADPVNATDPSGHVSVEEFVEVAGDVIGNLSGAIGAGVGTHFGGILGGIFGGAAGTGVGSAIKAGIKRLIPKPEPEPSPLPRILNPPKDMGPVDDAGEPVFEEIPIFDDI